MKLNQKYVMYYFYIVISMCIVYYVYWSSGFVQSKLLKKKKLNLVKLINLYVLGVYFLQVYSSI